MDRKEKFTPDEVNFTDYMVEKIAAAIRGGEIMGTVKDDSVRGDLERLACLISAAPEMYDILTRIVHTARNYYPYTLGSSIRLGELVLEAENVLKTARGEE